MSISFKISHFRIKVVVPYVGGGFGGKAGINLEPLVACLSKKAGGRPVKIVASRERSEE
ncbi:MAG: molybdopterin-dependent oxidoreductase, partial [Firmicutes bacterium]|nr:molybdopterin-dependent oxidoreductase [Bacillota bacterium]